MPRVYLVSLSMQILWYTAQNKPQTGSRQKGSRISLLHSYKVNIIPYQFQRIHISMSRANTLIAGYLPHHHWLVTVLVVQRSVLLQYQLLVHKGVLYRVPAVSA